MALIGEYELKQALRKEQKPRIWNGEKLETCSECPRLWKDFKERDYGLCQAMGFKIRKPDEMCRMCPLPLYKN